MARLRDKLRALGDDFRRLEVGRTHLVGQVAARERELLAIRGDLAELLDAVADDFDAHGDVPDERLERAIDRARKRLGRTP